MEEEVTGLSEERARDVLVSALVSGECLVHLGISNEIDGFVITNARSFFGRDFVKLLMVSPDEGDPELVFYRTLDPSLRAN